MVQAAERMRAMRARRRTQGLRELRLVVPDPHAKAVLRRVAKEVAGFDRAVERDAMRCIEAVSDCLPDDLRRCGGAGSPRHDGALDDKDVARLNVALAFVMGLAD